jgi:hypothetical protein
MQQGARDNGVKNSKTSEEITDVEISLNNSAFADSRFTA